MEIPPEQAQHKFCQTSDHSIERGKKPHINNIKSSRKNNVNLVKKLLIFCCDNAKETPFF